MTAPARSADSLERRLELTLSAVGAWKGTRIRSAPAVVPVASPMRRGVAGACFKVEVEGSGEYFVKLVHDEISGFVDLPAVADASAKAAGLGVAPKLHFALPEHGALIYEFLPHPWRHAYVQHLADRDVLEKLLAAKKRIHRSAPFARTRSILDAVEDVVGRARSDGAPLPPDAAWMLDNFGDMRDAIMAAGYDRVPCHGDGVASNVMLAPEGGVMLVGFYSAANDDPFHDLGSLLAEIFQFDDEAQVALEMYGGKADEKTLNRCRLYGILDDLYWGIWGLYVSHRSPRRTVEFFKYGQWRLLRCRMRMNDWRFEEWLRRI